MRQDFRFSSRPPEQVRAFLRTLASHAQLEQRADDFFVFTALPGKPAFSVDFMLEPFGLRSACSGECREFLGLFITEATGWFGPVTVEDV
jgi:hypothetical protein